MKIGYFCYNLSGTGPRTRAKNIINGIAEKTDHEVIVLTNEPELVSEEAQVIEITLANIFRTAWQTKKYFNEVDVVQVPINIYQVLFVRMVYFGPLIAGVGPGIQSSYLHRLLGKLLNIHIKMVVHEESSRWSSSGFDTKQVTATIDRDVFHPYNDKKRDKIREELNIPDNVVTILYVGELNKRYGANILKQMAKQNEEHEELMFIVIGEGQMENQFKEKGYLRYEGFVRNEELPDYYNIADITVGPRKTDVTSNVGLESISCGTPFITTADGLIREIFEDNGAYIWADRNPKSVLNAARELIDDCERYKEQVDIGLKTFNHMSLTIDSAIDTHVEAYECLSQSNGEFNQT